MRGMIKRKQKTYGSYGDYPRSLMWRDISIAVIISIRQHKKTSQSVINFIRMDIIIYIYRIHATVNASTHTPDIT